MSSQMKSNCGQTGMGLLFGAVGVVLIVMVFVEDINSNNRWVPAFAGLVFLVAGLWLLQIHQLWIHRLPRLNVKGDELWGGLLSALMGLFLVIMSLADDEENFNGPRWIVTGAGGAFFFAGLTILWSGLSKNNPQTRNLIGNLFVVLLITCFAAVPLGLVLDPQGQVDTEARICFSPAALLLTGMAAFGWFRLIKDHVRPVLVRYVPQAPSLFMLILAALIVVIILVMMLILVSGNLGDLINNKGLEATATAPF